MKALRLLWLLLCCASSCAHKQPAGPQQYPPIAASGGAPMNLLLPQGPYFVQTDSRWAADKLGNTQETMGKVGCVVCNLAMSLYRRGFAIDPGTLNQLLRDNNGFNERGWLEWEAMPAITQGRHRVEIPHRLAHEVIDQTLVRNIPVITKIRYANDEYHWVLIYGKAGLNYLVKDPLDNTRQLRSLSEYPCQITAIRFVQ